MVHYDFNLALKGQVVIVYILILYLESEPATSLKKTNPTYNIFMFWSHFVIAPQLQDASLFRRYVVLNL